MNKLKYYMSKYKIIVLAIIVFIIIMGILFAISLRDIEENKIEPQILQVNNDITEEVQKEVTKIKVDIKGYIKKSGVYELEENSRVIDVINMAGGLKDGANTEYINLSKIIKDQDVIIIYSDKEIEELNNKETEKIYIMYECECPDDINDACINEEEIVNEKLEESESSDNSKISINEGSLEQLMTLSGIGESKAKSIIEYRESNGPFKSIEDIMNVSGIGESAYTKIKDYIKL